MYNNATFPLLKYGLKNTRVIAVANSKYYQKREILAVDAFKFYMGLLTLPFNHPDINDSISIWDDKKKV